MISFTSPWLLLALVAPPAVVAGYVWSLRRRARRAARLAEDGLVVASAPRRLRLRRHLPFALLVAALTVLSLAVAQPVMTLSLPQREGTVILAFDVSNSMRATDLEPSRIEAAKVAARGFVEQQPREIRIGIVAFGESAVTVLRPTNVRDEVLAAIDRLAVNGGTSLGRGLFEALRTISGKPLVIDEDAAASDGGDVDIGFFGSAAIVLLSDGENTSRPDPQILAQVASTAGVHIHAIGLGTEQGTVVEVDGFNVATALDGELLTEIAELTDGSYRSAADAETLAEVYRSIDLELGSVEKRREVTALFTAAGGLLLVLGSLCSRLWLGRAI